MVKVAVLCIFAMCIFHLSAGARIVRDVQAQDTQQTLDTTLQQLSQFLEQTFSKQNMEKIGENLKKFGEQIQEHGKELAQKADAEIKKLQTKTPEQV